MAQFNMPLHHMPIPDDKYVSTMERYHGNGMTSPHELGPWLEQSEAGGKFQLKRRRRCGQCGPCQVKDNCNKCQYCLRKDVLKQACVQRKCVYLRKPVPRFQPESGGGEGGGSTVSVGSSSSCSNGSKDSPMKPSPTPSVSSQPSKQPTPTAAAPVNPSAVAAAAAVVQSAELTSCQGTQNTFTAPASNNSTTLDPRRASALEQHRSALLDATGMLEARPPYVPNHRGVETGRSPAQALQQNNSSNSALGVGNNAATSPAGSATKDCPLPREQFRSPMEQWGAVPYGFPHPSPWAHPALQASQAAAYGFQSSTNHYTNPFGSSCQLGMSDPAGHFATASQPSFHHNMPFTHPDFSAHANFHASAPSVQSAMATPFYPPPHIPPSLPNFPSFSQLPSSTGAPGGYPMAHPPMYPGSFYSSFRPSNEPQIYHVHVTVPDNPFSRQDDSASRCSFFLGKHLSEKEDKDVNLKKSFSVLDFLPRKPVCDVSSGGEEEMCLSKKAANCALLPDDVTNILLKRIKSESGSMDSPSVHPDVDEDLQQQLDRLSGRGKCNVIGLEDLQTLTPLRCNEISGLDAEPADINLDAVCSKEQVISHTAGIVEESEIRNKYKNCEELARNSCVESCSHHSSCRFCDKNCQKSCMQTKTSMDNKVYCLKTSPHSKGLTHSPELAVACVRSSQKQEEVQVKRRNFENHGRTESCSADIAACGVALSEEEDMTVTVCREMAGPESRSGGFPVLQENQEDESRNNGTLDPHNRLHSITQNESTAYLLQSENALCLQRDPSDDFELEDSS